LFLAAFNMIPAFPMDGGRVLRAALATQLGYVRATEIAASIGQWVAFALGFVGLFYNPLLIFIAIFVYLAAASEAHMVGLRAMSRGVPVTAAMVTQFASLKPSHHLDQAIETLLHTSQSEFPVVDDAGRLVGFLDGALTNIGTAQNVNQGFDADTGLRWGRWADGVATVGDSALDLTSASLHWIYGPTADRSTLPITGTRSYTLIGNTNPTDNANSVGFLGSATLSADFTNMTVDSTLTIGFGDVASGTNTLWEANGSGSIVAGTATFEGSYTFDEVSCLSCGVTFTDPSGAQTSGNGSFTGFFTPGADAAGLVYELIQSTTIVSGAAAFEAGAAVVPEFGAP
jgi:hypothetical protein